MATAANPASHDLDLKKSEASSGGDSAREKSEAPEAPIRDDSEKSLSNAAETPPDKNIDIICRENNNNNTNYEDPFSFDDDEYHFPEENDKEEESESEDDMLTQMWEENCRAMDDELQRQIDEEMDKALQDQLDQQLNEYFSEQDDLNEDELINDSFTEEFLNEGLSQFSWDNHGFAQQQVADVNNLLQRLSQTTITPDVKQQPTFEAINADIQKVINRHANMLATEEKD